MKCEAADYCLIDNRRTSFYRKNMLMDNYRLLTDEEILTLEDNGCTAEDWTSISVAEDFKPVHIRNVCFYGEVNLGVFEKNIEVSGGFMRHSGIRNATLRNVTVGDNCLIENIGNFINNYIIGEECLISNVCVMETTDGATFGEGNNISVLNETGSGNVMLFYGLTSNLAALMIKHSADKEFSAAVRKIIRKDISRRVSDIGMTGDNVRIVNTSEITNTHIGDNCEINGACRLSDCTIMTAPGDSVYIGSGVICENSVIADGSAVLDGSKINNCYVGEASHITNGFTAENSLFFANCHMSNGEACAAFCGPFSASHHKSSLLIGCMTSFYNAGSATNFSNHAYKMGPVHYGILERGSKTASGSHMLLPARIGAFSVCLGKIAGHPDTTSLPFSYIIADGRNTYIVPGKNLVTVGLYRDIRKWPRRDIRTKGCKRSIVNYDWLNPMTIDAALKGLRTLENLRNSAVGTSDFYFYEGCRISRKSLQRGIRLYDMAIKMFVSEQVNSHDNIDLQTVSGTAGWSDLSGLLLPVTEEELMVDNIKGGITDSIVSLAGFMQECNDLYADRLWPYTMALVKSYLKTSFITVEDMESLRSEGNEAWQEWIGAIKQDAEKEYSLGDVERSVLDTLLNQLDGETGKQ